MPTVILLDTSSTLNSMSKKHSLDSYKPLQVAINGISSLLDHISLAAPLEFISVVTYTYSFEIITQFTREIDSIKSDLLQIKLSEKFQPVEGLKAIDKFVINEWGSSYTCNVIVVSMDSMIPLSTAQISFSFLGNLILVCLSADSVRHNLQSKFDHLRLNVKVYTPDLPISSTGVQQLFNSIGERYYTLWVGNLICGNFNSKISLTPSPEPQYKESDFDYSTYTVEQQIEICGFIELQHVASPGAVSRHLVLPYSPPMPFLPKSYSYSNRPQSSIDSDDESQDDGQVPSFCVLLHGALKVENMAALCQIANNWYGVLFSWADTKKKSNLMLSLLEPGAEPIPWLGNLNNLTIKTSAQDDCDTFPIKITEKKGNPANCVAWIRQSGFQTDIQKILRHARKIPDKTMQFYKELNRVRRAAICLGFLPLIEGLAAILERECTTLPGNVPPACAFQLSHAAGVLRDTKCSHDIKYVILPMKMTF